MRITMRLPILMNMLLFSLILAVTGVQAQTPAQPQDHAQLYKRAVSLLEKAERKLAGNFTAEAKSLAKEANAIFSTLNKEVDLSKREFSEKEVEQLEVNNKMGEDAYAQGLRLEKSAKEKEDKSAALEKQGQDKEAVRLQAEAVKEYDAAHKMHVKSLIYNLKNQQLNFSFLRK